MLNVSKRSPVDSEFSVSTFGIGNATFCQAAELPTVHRVEHLGSWPPGQFEQKNTKTRAGQKGPFSSSSMSLPSYHRDGGSVPLGVGNLVEKSRGETDMEGMTPCPATR